MICLFKIRGSHFMGTLLSRKAGRGWAGQMDMAGLTLQGSGLSSPEAEGSAISPPKASPALGIWGSLDGNPRQLTREKKKGQFIFRDILGMPRLPGDAPCFL